MWQALSRRLRRYLFCAHGSSRAFIKWDAKGQLCGTGNLRALTPKSRETSAGSQQCVTRLQYDARTMECTRPSAERRSFPKPKPYFLTLLAGVVCCRRWPAPIRPSQLCRAMLLRIWIASLNLSVSDFRCLVFCSRSHYSVDLLFMGLVAGTRHLTGHRY